MTLPLIRDFLKGQKLGVVGSISPDGAPQSAVVGIAVTRDLEIIFDTLASSRKYRNLKNNPAASFSIGWSGTSTVQYEGTASELTGDELAHYQPLYFETWPDGPTRLNWPGITYFIVRPHWIRFSEFANDPPMIKEFKL